MPPPFPGFPSDEYIAEGLARDGVIRGAHREPSPPPVGQQATSSVSNISATVALALVALGFAWAVVAVLVRKVVAVMRDARRKERMKVVA
eukprot:4185568-Prymnesium_polylepis.1